MRRLFSLLASLTTLTLYALGASAQESAPLEFALADFPPYFQLDHRGEPSGPVLELAAALFTEADVPYSIRGYPAARLYKRLQLGQTTISMAGDGHPEMLSGALQGSTPVFNVALNVYRKPLQPAITGLPDLSGQKVILIGAYSYGALGQQLASPQARVEITHAHTHTAGLQMLLHDRAPYLINYADPMNGLLEKHPAGSVTSDPLLRMDVYLFVSRAHPNARGLLDSLDSALALLKQRGQVQQILDTANYQH
ncbi:substrate-binding periplasmic protein [Halopseudomonas maritima]|uniref:substrate-binding periplasmic protein n=1 Tax=Halopseudomonas maritima TaxID=2918528 RepID=UPI001EEBD85B|nr:transporter substrate-binding domain-containing protein [Halopseudomonas maritima]UJJ30160.1 transporter substrate-binding domain-containing protein [Halopseudomonas maritima]